MEQGAVHQAADIAMQIIYREYCDNSLGIFLALFRIFSGKDKMKLCFATAMPVARTESKMFPASFLRAQHFHIPKIVLLSCIGDVSYQG